MLKLRTRFSILLTVILVTLAFTGCSARSAIDAQELESLAKGADYTVTDATEQLNGAKSYLIATNEQGGELHYAALADTNAALKLYNRMRDNIQTGDNKPTNVDSSPYAKYTVTNGELYYRVCRVNNTVIYAKSSTSGQADLDKLLDSIHY